MYGLRSNGGGHERCERWQRARTVMVVAEHGTGKTLISRGAIHVRSEGYIHAALRCRNGLFAGCAVYGQLWRR